MFHVVFECIWEIQGVSHGPRASAVRENPTSLFPPLLKTLAVAREAPGLVHAIYQGGLKYTPLAVLSRPVAGTRNNTLVITLPGSVKAVKENLGSVAPLLPRIINLLQGNQC